MSVYAPGRDTTPNFDDTTPTNTRKSATTYQPSRGPGGVFANFLQGATPKYAKNNGFRADVQQKNTLARLFIRIDPSERDLFFNSIEDTHTRVNLAHRLAGVFVDPVRRQNAQTQGTRTTERQPPNPQTNGYLDFLITNVQHGLQEKVQVSETLADNWVGYYFGQSAPQWQYSGVLINSVQDDQASNFFRLYLQILRGTQLARRQKAIIIRYDSYNVIGSMNSLQMSLKSDNELLVPFGFTLLVKKVIITNYTAGWRPIEAGTSFATDVNAVAFDGRPLDEAQRTAFAARTPEGTEEVPVPRQTIDARTIDPPPGEVSSTADGTNNLFSSEPTPNSQLRSVQPADSYAVSNSNYTSRPETLSPSGVNTSNPDVRPSRPPTTHPELILTSSNSTRVL